MSSIQKANALVPSPQKYVQDALATIGVQNSRTCGTMSHALQVNSMMSSYVMHECRKMFYIIEPHH